MNWLIRPMGLLLTALLAGLAGCQPPSASSPATSAETTSLASTAKVAALITGPITASVPAPPSPASAGPPSHEAGRRIWNFRCYYCHGYSGDARTLAASFIQPPPRDFRASAPDSLSREAMLKAVREGRPGTAMVGFSTVLSPRELEQVVDFVREEFMKRKAPNTRYHTAQNGWPEHERYKVAFPFATGDIPLDRAWEQLDPEQTRGKQLFLSSCISCHDRATVTAQGSAWEIFGVSYPPGNYQEDDHGSAQPAHANSATDPYELHETPPRLKRRDPQLRLGERVFQRNCAHCHAADGTGKNWIGSFLVPHPPDFTQAQVASRLTRPLVAGITRDGLPGSSMPAWKSVLSAREIEAVASYVAEAFGSRVGSDRETRASGGSPRTPHGG